MPDPRVLLVHNRHRQAGGEDTAFAAELDLLRSRGHEVAAFEVDNRELDGRSGLAMAAAALWNRRLAQELRRWCRQLRPDIVHFHNTFPLLSPAALRMARTEGAAVVHTLHNFRLLCPNGLSFRAGAACERCSGRMLAWPGVLRGCYRGSRAATAVAASSTVAHHVLGTWRTCVDVYIALSEFAAARFRGARLPVERIAVLPNFLPSDPGPGEHGGGFALYVGRISEEKGVATLLKAWQQAGTIPLHVVGSGPLDSMLRARYPAVQWAGELTPDRVLARMQDASFLVFPSECYENCPLTLIEAFATGLPVIASRLGSIDEIVRAHDVGYTFTAGNASALAATIRQALDGRGELARRGRAARRLFEARYNADTHYPALLSLYARARRRHGPAPVG